MTSCLDNLPVIREYGSATTPLFWKPNGKLFYANGSPIIVKGFSAFPAIDIFQKIGSVPFFNEFVEFNNPRIFTYVEWGADSWNFPSNETALAFVEYCNSFGFTPSICLLTDGNPSRVQQAKDLINYLKGRALSLKFEAVNEPGVYNKTDPYALKYELENSGFPYASGWYSDNAKHYGNHWLDHSSRDLNTWEIKGGHNLYEAFNGGGPNYAQEPALKQPCIQDEPIRADQANYEHIKFYEYAASCTLLGGGATFHSTPGKFCTPLTEGDIRCKDFFLKGLEIFPPIDYIRYRRIEEPGQSVDGRTYVNGDYSIRIKQNGLNHPEAGWKSLDEYGIAWTR